MIPQLSAVKIIGVILALVALIGAVVGAYKMVDSKGYARGQAETNAIWQARESKELASANAMILIAEDKARTAERKANTAINQANHARIKADEAAKPNIKPVADTVAAGLGRLCDGRTASGQGADPGTPSPVTTTPTGIDAGGRSELFEQFGQFLSSEAARADAITRKLGQAQDYIRTALETCNGS